MFYDEAPSFSPRNIAKNNGRTALWGGKRPGCGRLGCMAPSIGSSLIIIMDPNGYFSYFIYDNDDLENLQW
jgi:hypothetical protein